MLGFVCPRCGQEAEARFYGPCDQCRTGLRSELSIENNIARQEAAPRTGALKSYFGD